MGVSAVIIEDKIGLKKILCLQIKEQNKTQLKTFVKLKKLETQEFQMTF